jgi:N-acetylated-alpha-linked acidic dipeptidase
MARPKLALNTSAAHAVNVRLMQAERQLTDDAGLPKRPWYRHLLYAPGFYTGYAVKTMPGVREAIEQKEYAEAEVEIARVAKALEREAALLDSISSSVSR